MNSELTEDEIKSATKEAVYHINLHNDRLIANDFLKRYPDLEDQYGVMIKKYIKTAEEKKYWNYKLNKIESDLYNNEFVDSQIDRLQKNFRFKLDADERKHLMEMLLDNPLYENKHSFHLTMEEFRQVTQYILGHRKAGGLPKYAEWLEVINMVRKANPSKMVDYSLQAYPGEDDETFRRRNNYVSRAEYDAKMQEIKKMLA